MSAPVAKTQRNITNCDNLRFVRRTKDRGWFIKSVADQEIGRRWGDGRGGSGEGIAVIAGHMGVQSEGIWWTGEECHLRGLGKWECSLGKGPRL